ncbi:MAG: ATP-binding cassette domain-containing protein [Defluviitaleaceae bacterium]|nr:ATP-binding cassette domain-containing protein [Defluviitaleaceae bacterium]
MKKAKRKPVEGSNTLYIVKGRNDQPMTAKQVLALYEHDKIKTDTPLQEQGKSEAFTLQHIGAKEVIIQAKRLKTERFTGAGQRILSEMDFEIAKGELVYVVGKSGAGKTVLLKILGGYDKQVTSDAVFMKKLTWRDNNRLLKKHVGYVPQIDSLYLDLTPAKLLTYYRNHFKVDTDVYEILKDLGLSHRANEKIESLSGGERKRVSIAIELLRKTDVLLLDEPDSGLDPDSREDLSRVLDEINSKRNITILLSTHYQDNINNDDKPVKEIEIFKYDSGASSKGKVKMYKRMDSPTPSPKKEEIYAPPVKRERQSSIWDNLITREFKLYRTNAMILSFVSLICMGFLWMAAAPNTFNEYADALPVVFAMSCGAILLGLMLSINMVCKDYDMIRRELRMGIPATAIIASKTLLILVLCAVMSGILAFPYLVNAYGIYGQRTGLLYVSVFFTMFASAQLGLLVSAISRNKPQRAALSIPFVMLFQILFSGFVFEQVRVNLDTIAISNYSIRAMGSALRFDNENFIWDTPHNAFNSTANYITDNLYVLLGFFFLALILAVIFLYVVDRKGLR